ncbi:hypothetical protein H2199_001496 [Coniosporium tulheliwenetii]|uniref:Uncharacterized protein n=1 Tax=Coniosporium tulheliwenetii TaxID=3383036 RepID=A0ACC2ZJH7_9PEZI|nr:hypothetical protein H2199_001496 [Cladosporium sp. JES 115]
MAAPLTVRNLSTTPVELKLIERFGPPAGEEEHGFGHIKKFGALTKNVTRVFNDTESSPPKLADDAQSFARQDVNIRIEPWTTQHTDIAASERGPGEVLRLTFEADGQPYRIDTPSPKPQSQVLVPLVPDPRHQYTGVFIPSETYLTLYSSMNLNCWMKEFKDETPLSGLSIPGTHNSPTYHRALPSVRCQAVSPREQLENGVRFFDIRVQPGEPEDPTKDTLILVHGVFPISLSGNKYFRDLANDTLEFLDRNPSETVIMSIKREGPGEHTDQQLSMIMHDHYSMDGSRWHTAPWIPTLGNARNKIVLMRRFALDDRLKGEYGGRGWNIDAENWAYNTPNDTHGDVCVQDFCEVLETENIDIKIKYSTEHLERAAQMTCPIPGITTDAVNPVPPGPFYLNFLSASNFWKVGCWPEKIAQRLNPTIVEFLCTKHAEGVEGDGSTGIVVCDWVGANGDWDLVRCIVGMNSRLLMKEMGQ